MPGIWLAALIEPIALLAQTVTRKNDDLIVYSTLAKYGNSYFFSLMRKKELQRELDDTIKLLKDICRNDMTWNEIDMVDALSRFLMEKSGTLTTTRDLVIKGFDN